MLELDTVPTASAADRYVRWAGLLIGFVAARMVGHAWDTGEDIGILYAIPVFGLCAVGGVLAGDALTARPRGTVRSAGLAPRRVRDYVPTRMTLLLLAQAGVLVVLLIVAAVLAWSDDMGRAGRSLTLTCPDGSTAGMGPWPGVFYGLPILASLAVSTAACFWSLTRIVRRPGGEQTRHDRALAVVAAWGLLVSALLLGTASTASGALMGTTCDGTIGRIGNGLLWPAALVALVTVSWCLFTVISPKARVRR
ncbi:hypothetical protein [Actinacidiphila soli]|uniref:hypothetical protein n=1 Tax=Actinacidiphila soli TaxID=2487275 RepID=UPI000FCB21FB|nr:hypothetical protein [Actinacidiphila soli]